MVWNKAQLFVVQEIWSLVKNFNLLKYMKTVCSDMLFNPLNKLELFCQKKDTMLIEFSEIN